MRNFQSEEFKKKFLDIESRMLSGQITNKYALALIAMIALESGFRQGLEKAGVVIEEESDEP